MQKSITHNNETITYVLKKSARARRMRISVDIDATCVVTIPERGRTSEEYIEKFVSAHIGWITKRIDEAQKRLALFPITDTRAEYAEYKEQARELVTRRLEYFNTFYNFSWKGISIKNQKTRWGSCSSRGNINFSYKIALLPEHMADYIIVHELCHLGQMNHSHKFWDLVARTIPNHTEIRRELRKSGLRLG